MTGVRPCSAHFTSYSILGRFRTRGNRAKHLGRVAAEYTQLLYHASKARKDSCIFVDEIQWVRRALESRTWPKLAVYRG